MSAVLEDPQAPPIEAPVEVPASQAEHTPGPQTPVTPTQATTLAEEDRPLTKEEIYRPALGALSTSIGCAFLVGGMFTGLITPKLYALAGALVGVGMAVWAARAQKRPGLVQALSLLGVLGAGLLLLAIGGPGDLTRLTEVLGTAVKDARLHRPPSPFDPGWRALVPWTVGLVAYAAAHIGSTGRKPALGVLLPIPVIAFAAIAQPAELQVPAGIVAFVSFVIGLAVIYRADRGEGDGVSRSYEMKRALRTAPLIIILSAALIAVAQTNLLFPQSLYDPTERAQLPKSIPLKGIPDRILFTTTSESKFTGPWRVGVLDVYDGESWRLPPYNQSTLTAAPASGRLGAVFGQEVASQLHAKVTVEKLDGTVLPLPGRPFGITVENAPALDVDKRGQTVRVHEGQVTPGLSYDIYFAKLPTVGELQTARPPDPAIAKEYTDTSGQKPPPAVRALLDKAFSKTKNAWDRMDFIRKSFLDNVTSEGAGLPVPVPPSKVDDMVGGSKKGTPYEIVAGQVLLARWAGIPARIAYGFDHGEEGKNGVLEFHPKYGASWMELNFGGFGWFPLTGLPKHAKASDGSSDEVVNAPVLPSDQIQVTLFVPLRDIPKGLLYKQILLIVLVTLPFAFVLGLIWLLWPIVFKARRRGKRKQWAMQMGRAARIAVAYKELRDMATDLGVGDPYLTPLGYVGRVIPDDEHRQLAWLVTRCLWGDLQETISDDEVFAAEELSRSLRRRLFEAQPFTIRGISLISRLSLRNPYAPELLSPPLGHFSLKKLVRFRKVRSRTVRRRAKETADVIDAVPS